MTALTKSGSIFKGALILGSAMFLSKLIGFLYRIPMTAILGDTGIAIYGVSFNIYVFLLGLSAIGIPGAISRLVSECLAKNSVTDARRVFNVALCYTGGLSAFLSLFLFFGAEFIAVDLNRQPELVLPLKMLSPTIFIASLMAIVRGYFQGMNTMFPTALSQVVEQIFNALFSVVLASYFIQHGYGVAVAAAGSTMGTGIGAISGFLVLILLYRKVHKTPLIDTLDTDSSPVPSLFTNRREIIKRLLSTLIPMVIITSVFSIFSVIDSSMLSHFLPNAIDTLRQTDALWRIPVTDATTLSTDVLVQSLLGQYTNKYSTLINIPISLILIVSTSAIPSIAKSYTLGNTDELYQKIYKILRIGFLLSIPAATGLMIFAKPIMALMFPTFPDGGELVMHGALTIIFITSAQLCSSILQGMGKQTVPAFFAGIALLAKVLMNVLLLTIPTLHIYAVIYSTLFAYILFAGLNIYYLKRRAQLAIPLKKLVVKPLIASALMGIIGLFTYQCLLTYLPLPNSVLIFTVTICVIAYALIGLCIGMITREDYKFFLA